MVIGLCVTHICPIIVGIQRLSVRTDYRLDPTFCLPRVINPYVDPTFLVGICMDSGAKPCPVGTNICKDIYWKHITVGLIDGIW